QAVAQETLDFVVLDHAIAAEDLHAHAGDANGFFGAVVLDQRRQLAQIALQAALARFERRAFGIGLGDTPQLLVDPLYQAVRDGRVHPQRAQSGDRGVHVEQHVRDQRVFSDRLAHLDALRGVLARRAERGLGHAARLDADADACLIHERGDLTPTVA